MHGEQEERKRRLQRTTSNRERTDTGGIFRAERTREEFYFFGRERAIFLERDSRI